MDRRCDDDFLVKIYDDLSQFRKISPTLIEKKYGMNEESAYKICCKIWLMRNIEARNLAKSIEYG